MRGVVRILFLLSIVSVSAHAQFKGEREVEYPEGGVELREGWFMTERSKSTGMCVEGTPKFDTAEKVRKAEIKRVFDLSELSKQLDVSVDFRVGQAMGVGGSAKANFANKVDIKSTALNMTASAVVKQIGHYLISEPGKPVGLTKQALALLNKGDMATFRKLCGDGYVSRIATGGEFFALLTFNTAVVDEREKISASLEASGLDYSGSASAMQNIRKYKESSKLTIHSYAAGGSGIPIPISEAQILERIQKLSIDVAKGSPNRITMGVTPYESVYNWPSALSKTGRNYAALERLTLQYERYKSLALQVIDIKEFPGNYSFKTSIDHIKDINDNLAPKLNALQSQIKKCVAGGACEIPKIARARDYELLYRLPATAESFGLDIQQRKDLNHIRIGNEILKTAAPNSPEWKHAQEMIRVSTETLKRLVQSVPTAQNEAVYMERIYLPNHYRCKRAIQRNETDPDCLAEAEVALYRKKISAHPWPPLN